MRYRARKAIQDEAVAIRAVQVYRAASNIPIGAFPVVMKLFLDHVDHDVVADKSALIHYLLGFSTEGSLFGDLSSEHVTSGLRRVFSWVGTSRFEEY